MYNLTTPLFHLIYSEGLGVAELAELSLGAQQFGLEFWTDVGQQVAHVSRGRHGELREGQLQQTGRTNRRQGFNIKMKNI